MSLIVPLITSSNTTDAENLQAKMEDYKSSNSDMSNNSEDIPEAAASDIVSKDEKENLRSLIQQETPRAHTIMGSFEKWVDRVPIWKWQGKALPDPNIKSKIRILAITWNMNGREPPNEIGEILRNDIHHHIYIISVQECMRSIGKSLIITSKKKWEEKLIQTLGENYMILKSKDLGALHLVVFIHKSIRKLINCAEVDDVTTGLGNVIANKGGICISFRLGNTKIAAIGCHLAAGFSSTNKRNNDFFRIEKELSLPSYLPKHGNISERNDCTILAGDLNYRINGPREAVELLVDEYMVEPLLRSDQLLEQINLQKVPEGYQEGAILFAPTYRFDRFSSRYDSSKKQRIPAWTDRILYKHKNGILKQHSYDAIMQEVHSDHKPVFSQFSLKFENSQSHEHVAVSRETSCLCNLF